MFFNWFKNYFSKQNKSQDHEYAEKLTEKILNEDNKLIPGRTVNWLLYNKQRIVIPNLSIVQAPLDYFKKSKNVRDVKYIVTHWDATLSANHCYNILNKRKISTHLCIDNNGTVYQFVDLNDVAWHAGPTKLDKQLLKDRKINIENVSWNNDSIGIDFSNAYYIKYNNLFYRNTEQGPRPILQSKCQNMKLEHLGYYPQQIDSYTKVLTAITGVCNVEKRVPLNKDGNLDTTYRADCAKGEFRGIICHYHLTPNKIDCAGLELDKIVQNIKE